MNRLHNLDYLRGFAAFGIMIYHYSSWTLGNFTADSFMGRLGVYGVSIFYVLSGLTLFYVYKNKMMPSIKDVIHFFRKRVFRIFPLLWLTTFSAILLSQKKPDLVDFFLNLSGLFGFVKWDTYFSAGIWSIGNELVFYCFFPVFILLIKRHKFFMFILSLLIFGLYVYFAFHKLNENNTLGQQWRIYTNPLNQVFLFLGGVLIGYFGENRKPRNLFLIIFLLSGILLFVFYPVSGDTIHLVIGTNRLIFTLCCFFVCICFYKMTIQFPGFIHKPLVLLGEMSYSVYLLHPIVYTLLLMLFDAGGFAASPKLTTIVLAILSTLVLSHYVYNYYEKYFIKFGSLNKNFIA
jgi:peptidoglycan/LPS O-acetylase OafA/YrhL